MQNFVLFYPFSLLILLSFLFALSGYRMSNRSIAYLALLIVNWLAVYIYDSLYLISCIPSNAGYVCMFCSLYH